MIQTSYWDFDGYKSHPLLIWLCTATKEISWILLTMIIKLMLSSLLCIGESPSKYPFLKNNGSEAPKGPRIHYFSGMDTYSGPRIHYFSGMDTYEDFLRLKIHHTLAPLFRYYKRF